MADAPEHEAPPGERARAGLRRLPRWVVGLVVVGVGAAITGAVSGGVTSLGSGLWDRVAGESEPPPLTLDVTRAADDTTNFYFARAAAELGSVPSPDLGSTARVEWARGLGAADAYTTAVEVVVQGRSSSSVVLTGLDVRVLDRAPPPPGTVVRARGGDAIAVRHFSIDLDQTPPAAESRPSDEPTGGPDAAIDFPYTVSDAAPEVFLLFARTDRCDCAWTAELRWTAGGEGGATAIDDAGRPFRTVSAAAAIDYQEAESGLVRAE